MRALVRQTTVTLVFSAMLWLAFNHVISGFPNVRQRIDTNNALSSVLLTHQSQLAHLLEELHLLSKTANPKILLLGGSSMEYAFQANELEALMPGYEVYDISFNGSYGGGSIAECFKIMKDAYDLMSPAAREKSVFIFGTVVQIFSPGRYTDSPSEVDAARLHMFPRLYRRSGTGVVPLFGARATALIHRIIRPFWIVRRVLTIMDGYQSVGAGIEWLETSDAEKAGISGRVKRPQKELSNRARQLYSEMAASGTLDEKNLASLDEMLRFADARGIRFILLSLPYSKLHRDEYPVFASYLRTIRDLASRHTLSGRIHFLDYTDKVPEQRLIDVSHIDRADTRIIAEAFRDDWPF